MIVLITVHDSSCLVGFLPFVRQFDSAPQTNGVHRIRSSVQRFTCTARTCKDCRKRLIYIYTLCLGLICTPAPKGFTYKGGQSVCSFRLVRCKVLLLFTICIVRALYYMPFMQLPASLCRNPPNATPRLLSFSVLRCRLSCGGSSPAFVAVATHCVIMQLSAQVTAFVCAIWSLHSVSLLSLLFRQHVKELHAKHFGSYGRRPDAAPAHVNVIAGIFANGRQLNAVPPRSLT